MKKIILAATLVASVASAAEIYKWKDSSGKVHFGDERTAPSSSQKIDVPVSQPGSGLPPPPPARSTQKAGATSGLAVPSHCKALIDEATKDSNVDRQGRAQAFVKACPGIAYHCWEYPFHPGDSFCQWVSRRPDDPIHSRTVVNN